MIFNFFKLNNKETSSHFVLFVSKRFWSQGHAVGDFRQVRVTVRNMKTTRTHNTTFHKYVHNSEHVSKGIKIPSSSIRVKSEVKICGKIWNLSLWMSVLQKIQDFS